MLAVNETEKLHGEQLLQLNISLLTQPANEGNKHLWGGMSTLNSKNFMHHPAGALGKLLWKLEGLGYPLGGTFPAMPTQRAFGVRESYWMASLPR